MTDYLVYAFKGGVFLGFALLFSLFMAGIWGLYIVAMCAAKAYAWLRGWCAK